MVIYLSRLCSGFLSRLMNLSMCICTDAVFLVLSTSAAEKCFFPQVNAGIKSSFPQFNVKSSLNVKPQSAKILSPGQWYFKVVNSESLTIWISEARPPQHLDKKFIAPRGVHDINTLMVQCLLYWLKHCALASKFLGDSINILKQSIIDVSLGNLDLKAAGIASKIWSLSAIWISCFNVAYIISIQR